MIAPGAGHLGPRVSALLDGHLGTAESERAWAHVHGCGACRDLVEREGWVKHRLARLSGGPHGVPDRLKVTLLGRPGDGLPVEQVLPVRRCDPVAGGRGRRTPRLASVSGGAVGCAVVGVLALGAAAPASAPAPDRRLPAAQPAPVLASPSGFTPAAVRGRSTRR